MLAVPVPNVVPVPLLPQPVALLDYTLGRTADEGVRDPENPGVDGSEVG